MEVTKVWTTPEAERLIMYIARVSNPANQDSGNTRLINYLIEHKHWSPFEMASMCIEIVTSRAMSTQIIRHRSFSFQEFSQRYARVTEFEPIIFRKQAEKNRQSSTEIADIDPLLMNLVQDHLENAHYLYDRLLDEGVARESARMILPLTAQTKIYMTGNLRSWIHYIELRVTEDTQLEHRIVAKEAKKIFMEEFPIIAAALEWS